MPDVQRAWKFLEDSDPIASADEVQAAVRRVAAQVKERLAGDYPLVLAVMGGVGCLMTLWVGAVTLVRG